MTDPSPDGMDAAIRLVAFAIAVVGPIGLFFLIAFSIARNLDKRFGRSALIAAAGAAFGLTSLVFVLSRIESWPSHGVAAALVISGLVFWFGAVPTTVSVFGIAAFIPEVRAGMRGETTEAKLRATGRRIRQETAAIEASVAARQAREKAAYLNGLTPTERALLELRMEAMARADARAMRDTEGLESENAELRQAFARLRERMPERQALEKQIKHLLEEKQGWQVEREFAARQVQNLTAEIHRLSEENARLRKGEAPAKPTLIFPGGSSNLGERSQ